MIDPKSIEKLKNQIDIVDIIEHFLPVKKMGANYKCGCTKLHNLDKLRPIKS